MNGKSKPYAIMVFGVPMSGKSQFASKFSQQFKAPHLNYEELPDIDRKTFLAILDQIAGSGQNIIIEGSIDTQDQRDEISQLLEKSRYKPVLVWVQTDVGTVKKRLKTKLKSVEKAKTTFDDRVKELEAPSDAENPIVISGKHTYDTQLKTILSRLSIK